MGKSIIIGAGKVGRGFIAHLLFLSGQEFCFVEKSEELRNSLNSAGSYQIYVLGNESRDIDIKGFQVYGFDDKNEIEKWIVETDCIFTSVGGKNLCQLVPLLSSAIRFRFQSGNYEPMNIITCENWKQPAEILRNCIRQRMIGYEKEFDEVIGFTESVILRSCIENSCDPLAINVQDYWMLPVDAKKIKGSLPEIYGLKEMEDFEGFLERKFYTYNAANGTVSYLGFLMGYTYISEAVYDEFIVNILNGVYEETSRALSMKQNYPLEKQLMFAKSSFEKLRNKIIVDTLERNARDPIRKLGPDDRLVGPARMALNYAGIIPENLCTAIAAAIYYENSQDSSALALKKLRTEEGIDGVLTKVCKLEENSALRKVIKDKVAILKRKGLIRYAE